jgi:phospholipase/carboxylesterase
MNRISTWEDTKLSPATLQATLKADLAACSTNQSTARTTFVPMGYEENYAYPLLVWLHAAGDDENQLRKVMPLVSLQNYVAIAPRAASTEKLCDEVAYCWCQSTPGIGGAERRVLHCVDLAMAQYNVAPAKVFLAGYADGGTMALRLGLAHADKFAGVASFGGSFPTCKAPLRNFKTARKVNILMAQGRDSDQYDEAEFCRDLRLLHYAGMSTTFRQYPGSDELTSTMLTDLNAWMMEVATDGKQCGDTGRSTLWLDDLA